MMSVVPGYVSRSAAGSYDNEAVSIFALLLTFWLFVKAIKTGVWGVWVWWCECGGVEVCRIAEVWWCI